MTPEEREKEMLSFATDQLLEAVAAPIKEAIAQSRENVRRQVRRETLEECETVTKKCPCGCGMAIRALIEET